MKRAYAFFVVCAVVLPVAADDVSFGSVKHGQALTAIHWEASSAAELSEDTLRLTQASTSIRSQPLPLSPLTLYRVSTTMARGPGSTPRFAISYVDARGETVEWQPAWQYQHMTHANWLPLSPRAQRYVQGFVLPLGATRPRLQLRLESGNKALLRYDHWTVTALQLVATESVACCQQLGDDLLLGGDLEASSKDGLPGWWTQWSATPASRVELVELRDDPVRKHVLRVKPGTSVLLASSYLVPVTPGRAYRLAITVRGTAHVELDVHSLSRDQPVPLRVGNATRGGSAASFEVQADKWRQLTTTWFAEAPNVAVAQAVIAITAQSTLELDAIELRAYEQRTAR